MHGGLSFNRTLLQGVADGASAGLDSVEAAVCVPYPYLEQARSVLGGTAVGWGAQNVSEHSEGAYTGEVSAAMLRDFDCCYVIVGHSERRTQFGESGAVVAEKFAAALAAGLRPILCVGETLAQRDAGETRRVIAAQLEVVLQRVGVAAFSGAVVAYEPVWAIGTGCSASPAQAQDVHAEIRAGFASENEAVAAGLRVIYGGSVKPASAAELFAMPDIDGALVGGASLVLDDFLAICRAAGR